MLPIAVHREYDGGAMNQQYQRRGPGDVHGERLSWSKHSLRNPAYFGELINDKNKNGKLFLYLSQYVPAEVRFHLQRGPVHNFWGEA
jgi:hypothetical protein